MSLKSRVTESLKSAILIEKPRIYAEIQFDRKLLLDVILLMIGGTATALQGIVNGALSRRTAPGFPPWLSFAVGSALLFIFLMIDTRGGRSINWKNAIKTSPWWAWLGGIPGAAFVVVITLMMPIRGPAFVYSIYICAKMVTSLFIDSFGFFGAKQRPATLPRLAGFAIMTAGVLMVLQCAATEPRNTNVTFFHFGQDGGAMLIKDNRLTSCELAIIDAKAAFVAASCLDLTDEKLKDDIKYEMIINYGQDQGQENARFTIDKAIHVHPQFNPKTLANNIAVVEFNTESSSSQVNTTPSNQTDWNDALYVRRLVTNSANNIWGNSDISQKTSNEAVDGCLDASEIYKANTAAFFCTSILSASKLIHSDCQLPYGSVGVSLAGELYTVALHSHTVVDGDTYCGSANKFSYFTILANYVGFASKALGRQVWTLSNYRPIPVSGNGDDYAMNPAAKDSNLNGGSIVVGDTNVISSSTSPPPLSSEDNGDSHESQDDGDQTGNSDDIKSDNRASDGHLEDDGQNIVTASTITALLSDAESNHDNSYAANQLTSDSSSNFKSAITSAVVAAVLCLIQF
ncbi:hypothetical protein GGI07_002118 [Coemansia sp. Benny D115]|nr:hypothetical protein GGI07_002118 [Coemansia sp. Benny D115]